MIALDVHTHLAPIHAARLAAMPGVQWNAQDEALILDGQRVGMKDLFHPERLLAWMDEHGIARALVSIPPPLYRQELDADDALAWTRYVNEELLAITQATNGKLGALAYLPLEHPALLDGLLAETGAQAFEGIALAAGGNPRIVYSDTCYDALWSALDARRAFVFLHPGHCADERMAKFYLENLFGNPHETGLAAAHLVMAGVPARYPGIRFCLAHAGGTFPAICGRLQRGFLTKRPGVDGDVELPLQAARRFWADGIGHHPATVQAAREVLGADHVLFGSDWPFPMGIPEPPPEGV